MSEWLITIALLIGFFLLIGIPIWIYESKDKKKRYEAAFGGRKPLDEKTFYEEYFQSRGISAEVVIRVKHILEEVLQEDLSCLRAEDDFNRNLSFFFQYDSMADVEIVQRLEEEFDIEIGDKEAGDAHTIEDIINLVWTKLRQRAA
jgi:acyl carrier protein